MPVATSTAFAKPPSESRTIQVLDHEVRVRVEAADSGGVFYMFEVVSPPGASVPRHVHELEDEIGRVISGEFDMWLDGEVTRLGPGGVLNFPRGAAHGYTNVGSAPGEILWVTTPGTNVAEFFDELGALPPGPPDLAKLAAIFDRHKIGMVPQVA